MVDRQHLYSVQEARQILNVSIGTLWRLIRTKRLYIIKDGRQTLVTARSVHRLPKRRKHIDPSRHSRWDSDTLSRKFLLSKAAFRAHKENPTI